MSPILLVPAHPDPSSLNHALAEAVRRALEESGHTVEGRWLATTGSWPMAVSCWLLAVEQGLSRSQEAPATDKWLELTANG